MSTIATSVFGDVTVLTVWVHGPIHPQVMDEEASYEPSLYETRVWGGLLEGVRGTAPTASDAHVAHIQVCEQVRDVQARLS